MNPKKSTRAKSARPTVDSNIPAGVPANGSVSDSDSVSENTTIVDTINTAIEAANNAAIDGVVDPKIVALNEQIAALEKKIASMSTENARKSEAKNVPAVDAVGVMESFLTDTDGIGRKAFIAALSKVSKIDAPIVGARVPKSLPGLFLELAEMSNAEMYTEDAAFKLGNTFGQNLVSLQAKVVNAKPNEKTGLYNDATMKSVHKLNNIQLKSSIARFAFGMMNGSDVGVDIQERARKGGASKIVGAPIANDSAKLHNEVKRKIG